MVSIWCCRIKTNTKHWNKMRNWYQTSHDHPYIGNTIPWFSSHVTAHVTTLKTGVSRKQSTPKFPKNNISYHLIRTRSCAYFKDTTNSLAHSFFISILFFWGVRLNMLMIFLIWTLYYAYNMLKKIESAVTVMN